MIDEQTQKAIEIILEITKLSEQALLGILRFLNESLENEKNKDNLFLSNDTVAGKQKIQDLIKKHENNVYALDENLTKEQLKDYEKEFKKLGIDFSVTKNDKDNYSFFFGGQQANLIEKALKNVVELKGAVLENEHVQNAEKELEGLKENSSQETVDKIKNLYDEIYELKEKKNELNEQLKESDNELSKKIEALDNELSLKESVSQETVDNVKNLYDEIDSIKEQKNVLNKQLKESDNELSKKIKALDNELSEKTKDLSPEELKLLEKFENVAGVKSEIKTMLKEKNIENKSENKEEKKIEFSMDGVKKLSKAIKERELTNDRVKKKEKHISR